MKRMKIVNTFMTKHGMSIKVHSATQRKKDDQSQIGYSSICHNKREDRLFYILDIKGSVVGNHRKGIGR